MAEKQLTSSEILNQIGNLNVGELEAKVESLKGDLAAAKKLLAISKAKNQTRKPRTKKPKAPAVPAASDDNELAPAGAANE